MFSVALIFIFVLFGAITIIFLFFSVIPIAKGAPFVPIHRQRLDLALNFLELTPSQTTADLGAGDGRILMAVAERGARAVGYEINPFLVLKAKSNIKKQGLGNMASCFWKSFWGVDFKRFDVIFIFGISHIMRSLSKKARKELSVGAKVVCFVFPLPETKNLKLIFSENGVYIYEKI